MKPEDIKSRRIKCRLNQTQAAEMIGVKIRHFGNYERGITKMPLAASELFKIKTDLLINENNKKF